MYGSHAWKPMDFVYELRNSKFEREDYTVIYSVNIHAWIYSKLRIRWIVSIDLGLALHCKHTCAWHMFGVCTISLK